MRSYRLAQRLKTDGQALGLIVVNSIEYIKRRDFSSRWEIFKVLQGLAKELSVAVLAVSDTNDFKGIPEHQLCNLEAYPFVNLVTRLVDDCLLVVKSPNGVVGCFALDNIDF